MEFIQVILCFFQSSPAVFLVRKDRWDGKLERLINNYLEGVNDETKVEWKIAKAFFEIVQGRESTPIVARINREAFEAKLPKVMFVSVEPETGDSINSVYVLDIVADDVRILGQQSEFPNTSCFGIIPKIGEQNESHNHFDVFNAVISIVMIYRFRTSLPGI